MSDVPHQLKVPRARRQTMSSEETPEETPCVAKARFCEKCRYRSRVFVPIAFFISNDGTDESTVCNRHQAAEEGLRYCKGCGDFVTLDLFPRGKRPGFACRKHFHHYGGRRFSHDKAMQDPVRKRRKTQWLRFCQDGLKFKHTVVAMSRDELEAAILKIDPIAPDIYAVMPLDTKVPTASKNVIFVTLQQRTSLMKLVDKNNLSE